MEKAPVKVAPSSLPFLSPVRFPSFGLHTNGHLLFLKNGIRDGFVAGATTKRDQKEFLKWLHSGKVSI
jgi:hypothetical protein